jgi:peptidoglycan/LPS O-acetylase OafA/YrhL
MMRTDTSAARHPSGVYFPAFDWLRGVLAITVMLGHDHVITWPPAGNLAVQVFFALSGWLIGGILLQTSSAGLTRFYFNRAVRIWVPYGLALVLLVSASLLRDKVDGKWIEFVFYKLTFVYNWFGTQQLAIADRMPLDGTGNHFWSVNAEEQFYLFAPLLMVLLPAAIGRARALWLLVAAAAWVTQFYASIAFGVLAAVLHHHRPGLFRLPGAKVLLVGVVAGTGVAIAGGFHYMFVVPFFSVGVVLLLAVEGRRQPFGAIVGGMSYPLYLNHWIGVFVGNAVLRPLGIVEPIVRHSFAAAFNIALAVALYWYVDRWLLARRAQFYTPARGTFATWVAYSGIALGVVVGWTLLALGWA